MAARGGLPMVAPVRQGLLWLLIAALCVYSCSGAVLRMLGPAHWHLSVPAASAPAVRGDLAGQPLRALRTLLAGIRSLGDQAHAQAHALGVAVHPHSHTGLQRHWHGADDDTVRLVTSEAADPRLDDLKAAAAIGAATLLPAFGQGPAWRAPPQANGAWPQQPAQRWRSTDTAPPTEPPIV